MLARVTIVTPTYNAARFIRPCIDSVLAQSFPDWELVAVDDGSTDGTPDLVASYGDPRIRVIRMPHRGLRALAETYNLALRAGSGELVAVLEGDDWWPADKLDVQVRGFDDPSVQLSWGAGVHADLEGRTIREARFAPPGTGDVRFTTAEIFQRLVQVDVLSPSITVMARRSAIEAMGGFRQDGAAHYVDLPTWFGLVARTRGTVLWHDHVVGFWRRYPQQTTTRFADVVRRERWRVIRDTTSALAPEDRATVGWTPALERANRAKWTIACGRAALRASRFARARRLFLATLRDAPGFRRKAAIGVASTWLGADLSGAWRRMRTRIRAAGRPQVAPGGPP
jgi:glycosyltransferase involved in cell wall biosynthesis